MEKSKTWKDKLIGTLMGVRTVLVILLICSVPVAAIILMTFGAIAAFERMALVPAFMALGVLVLGMFIFSDTDRSGTSELKEFILKTAFLIAVISACLLVTGLIAYFSGHKIIMLILDIVCDIFIAGYLVQDHFELS